MNRRKFLGACAGTAIAATAVAKGVSWKDAVSMRQKIVTAEPMVHRKLRWVNSKEIYKYMREGWEEYRHDDTVVSKSIGKNEIVHLMAYRG